MFRIFSLIFVVVFLVSYLMVIPNFAQQSPDKVLDTLAKAQNSYQSGEYRRCMRQLQGAVRLVQEKMVEGIKVLFPKPIRGWEEMGEASAGLQRTFSDKLSVRKLYVKSKTTSSIEVEIALDRANAANLRSWIANPLEMRNSSQRAELENIAGQRFVSEYDEKTKHGELVTVLGASTIVRLSGDAIKNMDDVRKFAEKLDYQKIRMAMK